MQSLATEARASFPSRTGSTFEPKLVIALLAPIVLWVALERSAFNIGLSWNLYFANAAAAFVYSYYCLARYVYIFSNGRDHEGKLASGQVKMALQKFHRQSQPIVDRYKRPALYLLGAALILDLALWPAMLPFAQSFATLTILLKFGVWLAMAPTFVLACAAWSETRGFEWSVHDAREREPLSRSFATHAGLAVFAVFLLSSVIYTPLQELVVAKNPPPFIRFWSAVLLWCPFGAFAIYVQCLWSVWAKKRPTLAEPGKLKKTRCRAAELSNKNDIKRIPALRIQHAAGWVCAILSGSLGFLILAHFVIAWAISTDAQILSQRDSCRFKWRHERKVIASFNAPCNFDPHLISPPAGARLIKRSMKILQVRASRGNSQIDGKVTLSVSAAKRAIRRGLVRVYVLPNHQRPIRSLPGWPVVVLGGMLLVMAVFFWRFFSLPAARLIAKAKRAKAEERLDG